MKRVLYVFLILLSGRVFSENLSINISEVLATSNNSNYLNHYINSNKWGVFNNSSIQSVLTLDANLHSDLNPFTTINLGIKPNINYSPIETELNLTELFIELKLFNSFQFYIGKKETTMGSIPLDLSSGSMTVSNNATPVFKVFAGFEDYYTIPFTFNTLEIKGNLSHGWLEGERTINNALLHEKALFARVNTHIGLYPYGGLVHEAIWGGVNSDGEELCNINWDNYIKIFFADEGGEDSLFEGEIINKLGNHLGAWEYGLYGFYSLLDFQIYYQHFFEDGSGMKYKNEYDGLWGIELKPKRFKYIRSFLFEFLTTKFQSGDTHNIGDTILGGLDSYYNHGIYKNGWTQGAFSIGNSFFTTINSGSDIRVGNNRMEVFNLGLRGDIADNLSYKVQTAYGEFYEAYGSASMYTEGDYAWFLYGELSFIPQDLDYMKITTGLAYDFGTIDDTIGFTIRFNQSL